MKRLFSLAAAIAALTAASAARANLLINGSLESAIVGKKINNYLVHITPAINSTALTGWTVESGMIDVVPTTYWESSDGNWSVDMVGTPGLGRISQEVATTAQTEYLLLFDLAFNFQSGPLAEKKDVKTLRVEAIGADGVTVLATQDFTGDAGTRDKSNMNYVTHAFTFIADGAVSTVRFSAVSPFTRGDGSRLYTGPVIDNLVLDLSGGGEVPEPASLVLLSAGALALLTRRTRRR
jgi:hypothetical protein